MDKLTEETAEELSSKLIQRTKNYLEFIKWYKNFRIKFLRDIFEG
jgi:hypothetical protein